jgi:hypothetical protein
VLHARTPTGKANTARGAARFVDEVAGRVHRAGATDELHTRMDSGLAALPTDAGTAPSLPANRPPLRREPDRHFRC